MKLVRVSISLVDPTMPRGSMKNDVGLNDTLLCSWQLGGALLHRRCFCESSKCDIDHEVTLNTLSMAMSVSTIRFNHCKVQGLQSQGTL